MRQRLYGNTWESAYTQELRAGSFGGDKPRGNMLMIAVHVTLLLISTTAATLAQCRAHLAGDVL